MFFRTDLALETRELLGNNVDGIEHSTRKVGNICITDIKIETAQAAKKLNKPCGNYITLEFPTLTDNFKENDESINIISEEIKRLLPDNGLTLVVGIGNTDITPDALGPKAASYILATRHISGELARSIGLDNLRPVSAVFPGVLGQTGIETTEFIASIVNKIHPSCVIAIDALASKNPRHLGCTIQISNTGISPGSGVGNSRPSICEDTLGVPVISIGVPTVVDASTLAYDLINKDHLPKNVQDIVSPRGESMMVTPREIDLLVDRASKLIGMSINCALQPDFSLEDICLLVC